MYNSTDREFIQKDPKAGNVYETLTQNGYIYCGDNPLYYIDPDGCSYISTLGNAGRTAFNVVKSGVTGGLGLYTRICCEIDNMPTWAKAAVGTTGIIIAGAGLGVAGIRNAAKSGKLAGVMADEAGSVSYEGGRTSGKVWDYSKQFDSELANFNAGYKIKNVIDKDLYLVQFHSNAEVGNGRSLKYWTTFDEANGISTVDDYMNQMALLSNWGARDNVSIAKISAGTKIKYAIGTAREQVGAIESRPGGGLQILFEQFDDGWVLETRPLP